jgi:SH3-like domain-containing protein
LKREHTNGQRANQAKMRVFLIVLALLAAGQSMALSQELGPVTNLPLPRFVSMKAAEGYARHGPGKTHRIDWVYKQRNQPLEITAEYGHWRRVRDRDGVGGWMHYSLLSGTRTVLVEADLVPLLRIPEEGAQVNAHVEQGVIARLGKCLPDWCRITAGGRSGWVRKTVLWGVAPDELRE